MPEKNNNEIQSQKNNNEITKRIYNKIRQKLSSLLVRSDSDEDDSLLQYILLLIANKHSKSQIHSDLSSFFTQNNCDIFVNWLWEILEPVTNEQKKLLLNYNEKKQREKERKESLPKEMKKRKEIDLMNKEEMDKRERMISSSPSLSLKKEYRRRRQLNKSRESYRVSKRSKIRREHEHDHDHERYKDKDNSNNNNARLLSVAFKNIKNEKDLKKGYEKPKIVSDSNDSSDIKNWSVEKTEKWAFLEFGKSISIEFFKNKISGSDLEKIFNIYDQLNHEIRRIGFNNTQKQNDFLKKLRNLFIDQNNTNKNTKNDNGLLISGREIQTRPNIESHSTQFLVTFDGKKSIRSDQKKNILSNRNDNFAKLNDDTKILSKQNESKIKVVLPTKNNNINPSDPPLNTKCQFWPNCTNGSECVFFHPTEICSFYPKCTFGNACHYIHVANANYHECEPSNKTLDKSNTKQKYESNNECFYGTKCLRQNCTFSHPKKNQMCKFGINCIKKSCNYEHLNNSIKKEENLLQKNEICRFDKKCTRIQCLYQHPFRDAESVAIMLNVNDDEEQEEGNNN